MAQPQRDDMPVQWRATSDRPPERAGFVASVVVFALPALVILFAGGAGTVWGAVLIVFFVAVGVVVGAHDWRRARRIVIAIGLDGPERFVVRQADGQVVRYPIASVERVQVIYRHDIEVTPHSSPLAMRITVAGRVVRTRPGPDDTARTFLAMCEEAGATMTSRTVVPD